MRDSLPSLPSLQTHRSHRSHLSTFARLRAALVAVAVVAPGLCGGAIAGETPAAWQAGFAAIEEEAAREWLTYLAGEECAGRGTGQDGYLRAAEYMAARFAELGLQPAGDDGTFFQRVPFTRHRPDGERSHVSAGDERLAAGVDFSVSRLDGEWSFRGDVVFLRMRGPDLELPEDLDMKGKALVLVAEETGRSLFATLRRLSPAITLRIEDGPAQLEPRLRPGPRDAGDGAEAPRLRLGREAAVRLARALGVSPRLLDAGLEDEAPLLVAHGRHPLEIQIRAASEEVSVPNVVARLPGSDPALADEHVLLGAHLDHLGVRGDEVYYGADDDGSGCTALLLVAKGLMANAAPPRRSVLFLAFSGEEIGLIGSRHYTENPVLPLDRAACLLQMDMVGRNEEQDGEKAEDNLDTIHLVGSQRLSKELHEITLAMNEHVGLVFEYDEERVYTRSDHYNFARKGVPITFLFSGFHPDYHRPTDTIEKINFQKLVNAARLNYLVAAEVASMAHFLRRDGAEAQEAREATEAADAADAREAGGTSAPGAPRGGR